MKKKLQLLGFIGLVSAVGSNANGQTSAWFENFGNSGTQRMQSTYVPTKGGQTFKLALSNGTDDEKRVQNNHLAIVNPNYIWETGYKNANNTWYWWTKPAQGWAGATIPYVKEPGYNDVISVNDHTSNSVDNGAVLVVNGGSTIAPLYKRSATVLSGKKYKVEYYIYVVQGPSRVSLDVWTEDATPVWTNTGGVPSGAYGLLASEPFSLIDNSTNGLHSWVKRELVFYVPTIADDGACLATGTPVDVNIILRNTQSENEGNDFYIDDIQLIEDPVEAANVDLICPLVPIAISGNVFFNSTTLAAGTGNEANRDIFAGATHIQLKLKTGPNTWEVATPYMTVPITEDGSYKITLDPATLPTNYGFEIVIGKTDDWGVLQPISSGWSHTAQGTGTSSDGVATDGMISMISTPLVSGASHSNQNFAIYNAIAPVSASYVDFMASAKGNQAQLVWSTQIETNNSGFVIERSNDSRNWSKIGFVTSSAKQAYSFVDATPNAGTNYYRLAQVDFDGTTTLSDVKKVTFNASENPVSVYPNPANNEINVLFNNSNIYTVQLIDLNGRVVFNSNVQVASNAVLTIQRNNLPAGSYILNLVDASGKALNYKVAFN